MKPCVLRGSILMNANNSERVFKNRKVVLIAIGIAIIVCILLARDFLLSLFLSGLQFIQIMNEQVFRLLVLVLTIVVCIQSVALILISRVKTSGSNPNILVESSQNQTIETPQLPKGRPKNPCSLALIGIVDCPLAPDTFENSKLMQKITETLDKKKKDVSAPSPTSKGRIKDLLGKLEKELETIDEKQTEEPATPKKEKTQKEPEIPKETSKESEAPKTEGLMTGISEANQQRKSQKTTSGTDKRKKKGEKG